MAVTAHAYERDKERSAGFAVHVSKPYDVEALIKVIGDPVERKPADLL